MGENINLNTVKKMTVSNIINLHYYVKIPTFCSNFQMNKIDMYK